MRNNNHAFPWGIYIGDLTDEKDTLPVCLPSQKGGFCVLFDDHSEATANNLIENVALKLFEVLPIGDICVDVIDFTHKRRFMQLSSFKDVGLYQIAFSADEATRKFNDLEKIALHRHHDLLSPEVETLSEYNQTNQFIEKYHLLIINLEHFPEDITTGYKKIKEFFNSAFEAGFYCLIFAPQTVVKSESKATQHLLKHFPRIKVTNNRILLDNQLLAFAELANDYRFNYVNTNKALIAKTLLDALKKDETNDEKEFLSIPIGKSSDGQRDIYFSLGKKSQNYHAFIAGVTGSGKTTQTVKSCF